MRHIWTNERRQEVRNECGRRLKTVHGNGGPPTVAIASSLQYSPQDILLLLYISFTSIIIIILCIALLLLLLLLFSCSLSCFRSPDLSARISICYADEHFSRLFIIAISHCALLVAFAFVLFYCVHTLCREHKTCHFYWSFPPSSPC